ncbi:MAG: hypothetical protein R3251_00960 [Candidatus Spechtbacterales bacterium]|nr:hypothetical protein [Candidatus Spechtbacterales bacterium]
MRNLFKTLIVVVLVFGLGFNFAFGAVNELGEKRGEHKGEEPPIEYWVEYLDPKGVTTAHDSGLTFYPDNGLAHSIAQDIPEKYFGNYTLYFSGDTMHFRIHIKNTGKRTYRNLLVLAQQELFNPDGGEGDAFGEPSLNQWDISQLDPGQEVILEGSVKITNVSSSGLDQTHLQILHWSSQNGQSIINGGGQILVDDSQAGIWCPVK